VRRGAVFHGRSFVHRSTLKQNHSKVVEHTQVDGLEVIVQIRNGGFYGDFKVQALFE
jgi:hypothetical protein